MTPEVKIIIYLTLIILNTLASGMCYYSLISIWKREKKFDHVLNILACINVFGAILNAYNLFNLF